MSKKKNNTSFDFKNAVELSENDGEEQPTERRDEGHVKPRGPEINLSLKGKQIMEENSENESDNHNQDFDINEGIQADDEDNDQIETERIYIQNGKQSSS